MSSLVGAGAALAITIFLGGCASGPKSADESAIALSKSLVIWSVPPAGIPIQAVVSAGDGVDKGSYRYKSQHFCPERAPQKFRADFELLCQRKGGQFDGQFCIRGAGSDTVLFSAQLVSQGGGCYQLYTSEALTVGSPEYLQFLVSRADYEPAEVRASKRAAELAALTEARAQAQARAEAEQQAKQAREQARLEAELPRMRKRGARVCLAESPDRFVYLGYVEDFTDEKLKISLTDAFLPRSPGVRPGGFQPSTLWDYPNRWRLC